MHKSTASGLINIKAPSDGPALDEQRATERGSALPLFVLGLTFMIIMSMLLVGVGRVVSLRAEAQSAADAAALAGVIEGEAGARRLAEANGGSLLSFESHESAAKVIVEVGGITAEATAESRTESLS